MSAGNRGLDRVIALAKVQRPLMETAKRSDDTKHFVVMPRRWVVENRREPWSLSLPSRSSSLPSGGLR